MADRADLLRRIGITEPSSQPSPSPATAEPSASPKRAELLGRLASIDPAAKLEKARAVAQNFQGFQGAEKFAEHLPGVGLGKDIGRRIKYRRAQAAIDKGTATDDDYLYVAHMERLDQLQGEGTLGQKVGRALLKVPAMAMEFAAGGMAIRGGTALGSGAARLATGGRLVRAAGPTGATRLTVAGGSRVAGGVGGALGTGVASSPLMGAVQGAQDRARLSNTDPTELRNAAPAVGLATLHGAVIGRLQQKMGGSKSLKQLLVKAPAAGAVGVAEKQAADTVGGLIDQMLPENVRMGEKFGLLGKIGRGETDAAAESALIDFTTFTAFAGLHGGPLAVKKVRDAFGKTMEEGQKAGLPPEQAVAQAAEAAKEALPESAKPPRPESEQQISGTGDLAQAGKSPTTPAEPTKATTAVEPTRPPESPPEATPEAQAGSDRRTDPQRRKLISEMTAEEARKELVTSRLEDESGGFIELPIPNARGYQEAELASPSKAKAFSDSDGLKALNDTFGYSAGNAMLAAKARVLKELGIDAYHQKGDEFIYRAENEAELRAKLEQARERLKEAEFEYTAPDGTVHRLTGADFSFGVGADLKTASEGMKAHKKEREAKGERGPRAQLGRIREVGPRGEDSARGQVPGSSEARTEAATEGKGKTLLDKMRARQKGQTATAKTAAPVAPTAPKKATVYDPPAEAPADPYSPERLAAAGLDSRASRIVTARRTNPPMTLDALGKEFGITRERVRQIEAEALKRLGEDKSAAKAQEEEGPENLRERQERQTQETVTADGVRIRNTVAGVVAGEGMRVVKAKSIAPEDRPAVHAEGRKVDREIAAIDRELEKLETALKKEISNARRERRKEDLELIASLGERAQSLHQKRKDVLERREKEAEQVPDGTGGTGPVAPGGGRQPQRAAEPAADTGLADQIRAARDTGLMPPGTPEELSSRVTAGRKAVNDLLAKVKALPDEQKIALAREIEPGRKINSAKTAERIIETEATAHLRAMEGSAFFAGFPIPKAWMDAMTRWVFGSPRGKDPAFTPDADPNPNNPRAVPPWQIAKEAAATQLGARIHTDAEKATTAYAWSKHVGEQTANEWQIAHANLDRAFEVAPDGTIGLAGGQRGYMADVVTGEMQRAGSQPLTPEQRQAVGIWKGVLEKQLKAMEAAGLKKFYDDQGNRLSVSDLLQRGYLPQLVKPKTAIGQAWNSLFGRTAQTTGGRPGVKPGFRKRRVHKTEEEGVKAGTEYVTSFSTRVAEFIKQSNREIADHHLANDPLLGGVDKVKPFFRKLLAERKHLKSSLTKQEWNEEVKRLRGLATQAASGNVFVAPAFRGKEYSPEVKAHLEMMYGDRGGRYLKFAQAASQELRNLVLGPDVSYATLQLQGMLFSNPVRWARTMFRAGEAFFKGDTIQRLAQEDPGIREAMQEIVQAGGSIGTRPEQIATLGGGRSLAERIPGYERFGRAFSTAIDLAKIELWRANKPADPSQWPRAIEAIENSLGSGRMEQLGMSPERAFLERLFFLAPSYYRGYTKLLQQGFDRGAGGAIARKQLGFMASGVLLTGVAGLYAAFSSGLISEDELYERLNPSRGKFLMVPVTVSDDKRVEVGMGGFYVSMVRTLANMAEKKSIFGPLGRWYRGHSGMLPRATADVGSGRDYFGNPISTEEAVAKSVLPIAAQDVVMGDGTAEQRAAQAGAGMGGFRAFPPSEKGEYVDALRRFAQGKTGQTYSDLGLRERAKLVREFNRTHKPPTVAPENRQVAQERAAAAQAERQKKLMAGVSAETRKRLGEFEKVLPSYDVDLAYAGVQIPMTPDERREYERLLIEEYDREIGRWPMDRLRRLNEKSRGDYMRRQLETAKERAKRRLMSPAVAR